MNTQIAPPALDEQETEREIVSSTLTNIVLQVLEVNRQKGRRIHIPSLDMEINGVTYEDEQVQESPTSIATP